MGPESVIRLGIGAALLVGTLMAHRWGNIPRSARMGLLIPMILGGFFVTGGILSAFGLW